MSRFPARMFRWAAIYGAVVLTPLYLTPLPQLGAEVFLGFVGLALVFRLDRPQAAPRSYLCGVSELRGRAEGDVDQQLRRIWWRHAPVAL